MISFVSVMLLIQAYSYVHMEKGPPGIFSNIMNMIKMIECALCMFTGQAMIEEHQAGKREQKQAK